MLPWIKTLKENLVFLELLQTSANRTGAAALYVQRVIPPQSYLWCTGEAVFISSEIQFYILSNMETIKLEYITKAKDNV